MFTLTRNNIVTCATIFSILKPGLCHKKQITNPRGSLAKFNQFESKSIWKKHYENIAPDTTVIPTLNSTRCASEISLEKLMEAVQSSEKQIRRIGTTDFRIEEYHITLLSHQEQIMKEVVGLSKQMKEQDGELYAALETIKADLARLQYAMDRPQAVPRITVAKPDRVDDEDTDSVDLVDGTARWNRVEAKLNSMSNSVQQIFNVLLDVKRRTLRGRNCLAKTSETHPSDCSQILFQGYNTSGIYKIKPEQSIPFYVLCDFDSIDSGWTLFQNRFDGSQNFDRPWLEYKQGFGNLAGEFWLGLDKLHYLTNQKLYELRVEMESHDREVAYAAYSVFTVASELEGYRISTLGNYGGTAGDSLSYHSGEMFSTFDVDQDSWKEGSCAIEHGGAWWYKACDKSNLNGKYVQSDETSTKGDGIYWNTFKGPNYSLMKTRMMVRPIPAAKPDRYGLSDSSVSDDAGSLSYPANEIRREIDSPAKNNSIKGPTALTVPKILEE